MLFDTKFSCRLLSLAELQVEYQNYKNNLQTIASKIGDVEAEAEEHK